MTILMHFTFAVYLWNICNSLEGPPNSVCKNTVRKEYCCYSYGEENRTCIKCTVGSESKNGGPCLPCSSMMYGENCAYHCNCTQYERCDRMTGKCRGKTSSTQGTSSNHVDYSNKSDYHKQSTLQVDLITHTSQKETTEETNIRLSTGKETENNDDSIEINVLGLSKRGVVVYIISIFGIIMILLILFICRHFRQKRQITTSPHNNIPQNEEIVEIDIDNVEGIYDLIDENLEDGSCTLQHEIPLNPYLEVIGSLDSNSDGTNDSSEGSGESHRDDDGRNDSTSYLNAYQPLSENWMDKSHVYDHSSVAIIGDSDQCSQNCRLSSVVRVNSRWSYINKTEREQKVLIELSLTKGKHQSQSSCPLYMDIPKHFESSFVMYRRKSI